MMFLISVILPTYRPNPARLTRTFGGLSAQTLDRREWELIVVDNASGPGRGPSVPTNLTARLVEEPVAGLTHARLRGLSEARGDLVIFVDDDNVLAPDFLARAAGYFTCHPNLAAAGGRVLPEFEAPAPEWTREFHGLLALRDLGPEVILARGGPGAPWPAHAPVGAGLCIRREAAERYADRLRGSRGLWIQDRTGTALTSGGDNDLVFTALHAGGDVGYFPDLSLTHLIPGSRLSRAYLARLNRGIMRSWVQLLARHGQCPWPAIPRATVPLRVARAAWRLRAWQGPAAYVRWSGSRGQFEGQADLSSR